MAKDTLPYFPGQIQAVSVFLQELYYPYALSAVGKARLGKLVKGLLTNMTERGMAQVVP
jgi:hypothetical protein